LTATDAERDLEQRRRARNRALGAVLVALVALFYAVTIARMGG
jgi:outer membrane protein TolC